jgi:hypothetical protein
MNDWVNKVKSKSLNKAYTNRLNNIQLKTVDLYDIISANLYDIKKKINNQNNFNSDDKFKLSDLKFNITVKLKFELLISDDSIRKNIEEDLLKKGEKIDIIKIIKNYELKIPSYVDYVDKIKNNMSDEIMNNDNTLNYFITGKYVEDCIDEWGVVLSDGLNNYYNNFEINLMIMENEKNLI